MDNPFLPSYPDITDIELVKAALDGDQKALTSIIVRHQPFIYNVAWKMVLSPVDAEDVTQEVLIKVITKLSTFKGESQFKTWLYRIVVNHVLYMKKKQLENIVTNFPDYFNGIATLPDNDSSEDEEQKHSATIEDIKISCTAGMLLCLDREQRMILVLGDIFGIEHTLGAEIFNTTPDNFRQKLSRARKDLYSWMNNRCGLVNEANPCRCPKKRKAFIEQGYVDPKQLKFNSNYERKLHEILQRDPTAECRTIEDLHREIFLNQPFKNSLNSQKIIDTIINNNVVKEIYGF